jgi:hypothetical protein
VGIWLIRNKKGKYMPPKINLKGMTFGDLFVLEEVKERKNKFVYWKCVCNFCECGKIIEVRANSLLSGNTQSCVECGHRKGKLKREKNNIFEINDEYCIGRDENNQEFYFDIDKLDSVKICYWGVNKNGYVNGHIEDKNQVKRTVGLHRYVMGLETDDEQIVDHIDRNPRNCLLSNLRIVTYQGNSINASVSKNSKTGVIGVNYYEKDRFVSHIQVERKHLHLGIFNYFEDAVRTRLLAEREYYGIYSSQQHLFEQYGIPPL